MKIAVISILGLAITTTGMAQTRSANDTATAYGARLTAKDRPADLNENRLDNRINSRLDNRLSLRIERYRPDSTSNPTVAYSATQNDKSRVTPVIAPQQPQ